VLRKPFTPEELVHAVGQTRQRAREARSRAEEKRARARLLQDAARAAHLEARQLLDRVDLIAAAIELRRPNGRSSR
jgi:FixJ family two-component response regulator